MNVFSSVAALCAVAFLSAATQGKQQSPDLSPVSLKAPEIVDAGQSITVTWQAANRGDGPAGPSWHDRVYFSTDAQLGGDHVLGQLERAEPLAAGASYSGALKVKVPDQAPGTYYLILLLDEYFKITETDEKNNVLVYPIRIRVPDLQASSMKAPDIVDAGQSITVTWQSTNKGDAAAGPSWYDRVYLSTDSKLGNDDVLGQTQWTQAVAAGGNYSSSLQCMIPNRPPGSYYLILLLDEYSAIYEVAETNNLLVYPIRVRVPDLQASSMKAPDTVDAGQSITVTWQSTNKGDAAAGPSWYDRVYLSTDAKLGNDDVLGQKQWTQTVAAGGNYSSSLQAVVPNRPPGSYYLILLLDEYFAIYEVAETNNVLVYPIRIRVPDLEAASLQSPDTVHPGQSISLTWQAANKGDASAVIPWYDRVYLSTDAQLGNDDQLGQTQFTQAVAAAGNYQSSLQCTIPNRTPGTYYLILVLDAYGNLYEEAETNNLAVRSIQLSAEQAAPACCDTRTWTEARPKEPLTPRYGHSMAQHATHGHVVLFGGNDGAIRNDTHIWTGFEWLSAGIAGPTPREFAAMAYDSARGRVVLFGGRGTNGAVDDTWEWDGASWMDMKIPGPSARLAHAMAYDSSRKRVVLYGGYLPAQERELDDTWEYDGTRWMLITNATQPGPRVAHAMAWDGAHVVLFGGQGKGTVHGDTWAWTGDKWNLVASTGPPARQSHAMAYDERCDRVVLFGGGPTAGTAKDDTWEWNRTNWIERTSAGPNPRWQHALAYHAASGEVILFGGYRRTAAGMGPLGDTWRSRGDHLPVRLVSIEAACHDFVIVVTFSGPVDPATASDPANYQLSCGSVRITGVVLSSDLQTARLETSAPMPSGTTCMLVISKVLDLCGAPVGVEQRTFTCTSDPCRRGSMGQEFWLTFPGNYAPDSANPPKPQLFITGAAGVTGTVTAPGLSPPFSTNFTIPANRVMVVSLPQDADLGNANERVESKGIHVAAAQNVNVYGYNRARFTTDAYLALANNALGRVYLVLTYQNVFTAVPELSAVQFALVGTEDNTTVAIVPSKDVLSHPAGVPFYLKLNQGETFQLRNLDDVPADLTGTIIAADQPIGVFGSHACANIAVSTDFFCDHIVEQMLPTEMWGRNFVAMPLKTRLTGDTLRILALLDGTAASVNGVALPRVLNRGQFFEGRYGAPTPVHIVSEKPLLVAQYANSSDADGVTDSDPFMVLIPPTDLYASSYVVQTPTSGFTGNYINLMAPRSEVGQILLDGVAIPAGEYTPIGASGYSGAQIEVATGPHTLHSIKEGPFGVIVYGWAEYDSYGYPGAICFAGGAQPPNFTCPSAPDPVLASSANCMAETPDLRTKVGNAEQAVLVIQDPHPGTLLSPGTHPITISIIDQFGGRQVCTTSLIVRAPAGLGLHCPENIAVESASEKGTVVEFTVGLCDPSAVLKVEPPSGSLFPIGTTTVRCEARSATGAIESCTFTVTVRRAGLTASCSGRNVSIAWTDAGQLQEAKSLSGPWRTVPGAVSPYRIVATDRQAFYRVVR
ncbi:MAG: CARDB domain-containing protein [Verrucomicrobiia bacterium]